MFKSHYTTFSVFHNSSCQKMIFDFLIRFSILILSKEATESGLVLNTSNLNESYTHSDCDFSNLTER